jgi:hypothetical protein
MNFQALRGGLIARGLGHDKLRIDLCDARMTRRRSLGPG